MHSLKLPIFFLFKARENLEALLGNIKGNNAILEEKLHNESLHRTQREREAAENKNLWESEVKSRSRVGVQVGYSIYKKFIISF